jgi:putative PIN family toxin of toxin-antitoxin system
MLRVVIDTSTFVSYVLTKSPLLSRLIDAWHVGAYTLVTSPETRAELAQVLDRPMLKKRAKVSLDELTTGFERYAETVPGLVSLSGACPDPKDDKFLACAFEARAHYLVSSDGDLLDLRWHRNTAIVNPGQFLLALDLSSLQPSMISRRYQSAVLERVLANIPMQPDTAQRVNDALLLLAGSGDHSK